MELEQGMASLTEWPLLHTLHETAEETVLITILFSLSLYSLSIGSALHFSDCTIFILVLRPFRDLDVFTLLIFSRYYNGQTW